MSRTLLLMCVCMHGSERIRGCQIIVSHPARAYVYMGVYMYVVFLIANSVRWLILIMCVYVRVCIHIHMEHHAVSTKRNPDVSQPVAIPLPTAAFELRTRPI